MIMQYLFATREPQQTREVLGCCKIARLCNGRLVSNASSFGIDICNVRSPVFTGLRRMIQNLPVMRQ
jgi:hypothetical protein